MKSMKKAYGFTLVELLITMVVIAILAAISVVSYTNIRQRAYESSAAIQLSQIRKEMETKRTLNGEWPFSTDLSWCAGATNYAQQNLNVSFAPSTICWSGTINGSVSFECMGLSLWESDDSSQYRTVYYQETA